MRKYLPTPYELLNDSLRGTSRLLPEFAAPAPSTAPPGSHTLHWRSFALRTQSINTIQQFYRQENKNECEHGARAARDALALGNTGPRFLGADCRGFSGLRWDSLVLAVFFCSSHDVLLRLLAS